jgi:hypothetical protein
MSSPVHGPYILDKNQELLDWVDINLIVVAQARFCINSPLNIALFQMTMRPPALPSEGKYINLSNLFGKNFLI